MEPSCPLPLSPLIPSVLLSLRTAFLIGCFLYGLTPALSVLLHNRRPPGLVALASRLVFLNNAAYGVLSFLGSLVVLRLIILDALDAPSPLPALCAPPPLSPRTIPSWRDVLSIYLLSKLWEYLDVALLVLRGASWRDLAPHFRIHHSFTYILTLAAFCAAPSATVTPVVFLNALHHGIMYPFFALGGLPGWERPRALLSRALEFTGTAQLLVGVLGGVATFSSRLWEARRDEPRCDVSRGAMLAEGGMLGFMCLLLGFWGFELRERRRGDGGGAKGD